MKVRNLMQNWILITASALLFTGCQEYRKTKEIIAKPEAVKAVCMLYPTEGSSVNGMVSFTKTDSGIRIVADMYGLAEGKHGFHIHEYGDCSSPDGKSAGGHFNPEGTAHGSPADSIRHVGDLGNIIADSTGTAHLEMTDTLIALSGNHSIIGRAVVVHKGQDDLVSQPTGNAGGRVACGVIGIVQ